jgi:hypothetical protein
MIRLLYAAYAFIVLFLSWRFHSDILGVEVARKFVIALWIGALVGVFADWKYGRPLALAAFVPVFMFVFYEIYMRLTTGGTAPVSQWLFEGGLLVAGAAFCLWLARGLKA